MKGKRTKGPAASTSYRLQQPTGNDKQDHSKTNVDGIHTPSERYLYNTVIARLKFVYRQLYPGFPHRYGSNRKILRWEVSGCPRQRLRDSAVLELQKKNGDSQNEGDGVGDNDGNGTDPQSINQPQHNPRIKRQ